MVCDFGATGEKKVLLKEKSKSIKVATHTMEGLGLKLPLV